MTRWQTFAILTSFGAKIQTLKDLAEFPWEKEQAYTGEQPTDEQIKQLYELMRQENENIGNLHK